MVTKPIRTRSLVAVVAVGALIYVLTRSRSQPGGPTALIGRPTVPIVSLSEDSFPESMAKYRHADARILAWTPIAGQPGWEGFKIDFCDDDNDLQGMQCVITHERILKDHSSTILFSSTDLSDSDLPTRNAHQPWVLYSEVSPLEHPPPYNILRPELMRHFDYAMSYRLDSDFPIAPFGNDLVAAVLDNPLDDHVINARFASTSRGHALWVNLGLCETDNRREELVHKLQSHGVVVDSLGGCPTNGRQIHIPKGSTLVNEMRNYKFVLLFETSNCHDYVSRTFLRAMQAQTVPIVDGPASYAAFLPHPMAAIQADQYSTSKDLASVILRIADDRDMYMKHLTYRTHPKLVDEQWIDRWRAPKLARARRAGWCGLCRAAIGAQRKISDVRSKRLKHLERLQHEEARLRAKIVLLNATIQSLAKGSPDPAFQLKVDVLPLPNSTSHVTAPHSLRAVHRMLAPDYSCTLAKWASTTPARDRYASSLSQDYLKHALPLHVSDTPQTPSQQQHQPYIDDLVPPPVKRAHRRGSAHADLHGSQQTQLGGESVEFPPEDVFEDVTAPNWIDLVLAGVLVASSSGVVRSIARLVASRRRRGSLRDKVPLRRISGGSHDD